MRIISGQFKGRRIEPPHNITARPTTDFAKESLFNVLNNLMDFEASASLDLFAGTGSISIELASRGCPSVLAIEQNDMHLAFIKKTLKQLGIITVFPLKADVFKFLPTTSQRFDFIFADPPYDLRTLEMLPDLVFDNQLLKDGGIFVLEHSQKNNFDAHPHFLQHRNYGNVNFTFFR
ncbi:MAG: 16S rRNA (guanine(966)-N(2))-methyltransferase RsmD [Prevotellaceae bacterium]|jgi:16S rRNA (guanine(966)-N(2))-methyltransferase RsmD|nr:16S rRNA (guanine(966)-N(2))-methyltransferase RsmD [Prevotellaceae bacterium]